jgi:regulator of nucleoside diphosphate kinase
MMGERSMCISEHDFEQLKKLLSAAHKFDGRDRKHLIELEKELNRSILISSENIPQDVITMNSKVRIRDLDSGEEAVYRLVFPHDADIRHNRISILAPIGTALLGYRTGDIIQWKVPDGVRKLKVEEILYQPEAAGDCHS